MGSAAEHRRPVDRAPGRPRAGGSDAARAPGDAAVAAVRGCLRARDFAGGRLGDESRGGEDQEEEQKQEEGTREAGP